MLWASNKSGSVMAPPGSVSLKNAKSSRDNREKGRLSGAAAGLRSVPSPAPECACRRGAAAPRRPAGAGGRGASAPHLQNNDNVLREIMRGKAVFRRQPPRRATTMSDRCVRVRVCLCARLLLGRSRGSSKTRNALIHLKTY